MTRAEPRAGGDLAGLAVFFERWTLGAPSRFDYELDYYAQQKMRAGPLEGVCNVGGVPDRFVLRGTSCREHLIAERSGASGRIRCLVAALSWALYGDPFSSLPAICEDLRSRGARAYLAEGAGPLHAALARHLGADLVASDYFGSEYASGATVNGRRHENLERTSFGSAEFDVVITTDVMEHVADAPAAEREIARILKPDGLYVFTIPFYFTLEHDRVRATLEPDGRIVHHEEPEYHGDPVRPDEGALVYRDFAEADLRARFGALGCSFEIVRLWSPWLGILGGDMIAMAARRAG